MAGSPIPGKLTDLLGSLIPNIPVGFAIATLLGLAAFLGWRIDGSEPQDATFSFIGIVIIFMAALTVAATIFVGLKLANPLEAFGLPAGSMRALLAIGVMILFVVFGLPMISPQGSDAMEAKEGTVPRAELAAAVQLHREQGLRIRILDYGSDAVPAAGTTQFQAARPARFQTFGRIDLRSPEEVDFGKQVLTAIITLLTSVISFYFGSRSAAEVAERQRESILPGVPGTPGTPGALSQQLKAGQAALAAELAAQAAKIQTLKNDPAVASDPGRAAALAEAEKLGRPAEALSAQLSQRLAAADSALAAAAAATAPEERERHQAAAKIHLQMASVLLEQGMKLKQAWADKVGALAS